MTQKGHNFGRPAQIRKHFPAVLRQSRSSVVRIGNSSERNHAEVTRKRLQIAFCIMHCASTLRAIVGGYTGAGSRSLNESNRLWLLKKGCVESEVGGYECRNQEEVLAS